MKVQVLAIAGVFVASTQAKPQAPIPIPSGPGDVICDSQITDDCGGDGQPACCYSKYTESASCLNGDLVVAEAFNMDCGPIQDHQKEIGCSCPPDCTTGDIDGRGQCI